LGLGPSTRSGGGEQELLEGEVVFFRGEQGVSNSTTVLSVETSQDSVEELFRLNGKVVSHGCSRFLRVG
jgi:hypothetical protein